MLTPENADYYTPEDSKPRCEGCGGPVHLPCICDYFADPDDDYLEAA